MTGRRSPIRVAHVVTAYCSVVTILNSKLRILDEFDDLDITVISSAPPPDESRRAPVPHISVPMSRTVEPLADLKSMWQLRGVLKRLKCDIVHSHTAKAGALAAVAGWLAGTRVVAHTYHGLPFFDGQVKRDYNKYHLLERIACLFRHQVFSQNRRDLRECVGLMRSARCVSFEGNGVDSGSVRAAAEDQAREAADDYPDGGTRILLTSRLEPVKRVDSFIRVIKLLKDRGERLSCVIAGAGPQTSELRKQISRFDLTDCINMVGFSDRCLGLIRCSDIVVLCSEKEGIPRSLMEAMALAKPVVATDVLGTQELVIDGVTGYLTPFGDTEAMAAKILLLAKDSAERRRMGEAGRDRVAGHFDDRRIAGFLREYYLRAVERADC
ncbi:MAG: glycosyltransferase [Planctomycetota bacterium]